MVLDGCCTARSASWFEHNQLSVIEDNWNSAAGKWEVLDYIGVFCVICLLGDFDAFSVQQVSLLAL
jgi:hypothetical protein